MKKILSIILSASLLMTGFGAVSFAADEEFSIESIEQYLVYSAELADDGYIGIPVGIKTYSNGNTTANSQVIFYVVNTNTERIGTDTDEQILTDLINRNLVVIVLDYKNNEKAKSPDLDWSIQAIRSKSSSYLGGAAANTALTYVLPAGYNITLDEYYWSIDKHGSDGSLERIVDVWNYDFMGTKGSSKITLADGTVTTVKEYTEGLEGGVATDITQLINKDGTPIDLDLRMDIIYPTNPENEVPVMTIASSSERRVGTWTNAKRPHLTGFVFNGYAGVVFDYAYTPMARTDHYNYFDGSGTVAGSVTGDNYTYSMAVYSGIKSDTAAIRKIRYLADYERDTYKFDLDKIGVYGNSKGGLCTRLGAVNVEELPEQRFFPGHHGETRYENGLTEDREFTVGDNTYTIDGGEEQPWLTYSDGSEIPSNVQFVYANCGGGYDAITEGHAPTYATGSMQDGSYYGFFPGVVNALRIYDIPSMVVHCPERGHEFAYGPDRDYGLDTYYLFHQTAGYYLRGDAVMCTYIDPVNGSKDVSVTDSIKVKFTGPVSAEEIEKVTVTNTATGARVNGSWSASYGRTEWDFTPSDMKGGYTYNAYVPNTLKGENGKEIQASKTVSFTAQPEALFEALQTVSSDMTISKAKDADMTVVFDKDSSDFENSTTTAIRFEVENDAANTVLVYSADADTMEEGELLGEVILIGKGSYDFDVTDYVNSLAEGKKAAFILKAKKNAETKTITHLDFEDDTLASSSASGASFNGNMSREISNEQNSTEGGSQSIKVNYFNKNGNLNPWVANTNSIASFQKIVKSSNLTADDYGRKFNVSVKVYDTISRELRMSMANTNAGSSYPELLDWNTNAYTYFTEPDTWNTYSLSYRIDNPIYYTGANGGGIQKKTLSISAETAGDISTPVGYEETLNEIHPIYIDDVIVTEDITDVTLAGCKIVLHPANKQSIMPIASSYVESGSEGEGSGDSLLVSGRSKSVSVGANKKVYAKVDLSDYSETTSALVKIKTTNAHTGSVLVYGAKETDWDMGSVNYINAPANDRYSFGVNSDEVFAGEPIETLNITGEGEYTIDISEYASYMADSGKTEATLIFALETEPDPVITNEDFNDGKSSFTLQPGGGPLEYKISSDASYPFDDGMSYKLYGNYAHNRIKMDIINTSSLTEADIGRSFNVTYKAKADTAGTFLNSLLIRAGANDHYQSKNQSVTEANTWQEFSYDFTITSDMITDSSTADTIPTWFNFQLGSMVKEAGVSKVTLYIDNIVVTETGVGDINFEFVNDTEVEKVNYSKTLDFEGLTSWRIGAYVSEVNDSYDMGWSGGDSGTKSVLSTAENHTDGGSQSLQLHMNQTYNRFRFYNLFEDNLNADDVGDTYTISFWAKSTVAGTFSVGMMSPGRYSTWVGSLYKGEKRTFTAADTWQKFTYDFTVDDTMLADSTVHDALKTQYEGTAYAGPFNPALFSIVSSSSMVVSGTACDMYVDDLKIENTTPSEDSEAVSVYSYKNDIESGGSVVWATSSNTDSDGPSLEGTIATYNGFTNASVLTGDKTAAVVSSDENHTGGGSKSIYIQSTQNYNRVYFYDIVDELKEGETFKVSFWMKADRAGTFSLCMSRLSSGGGDSNKVSYTIAEADVGVWKKYRYEFTVDSTMVSDNRCLLKFVPSGFGQVSDDSVRTKFYVDDLVSVQHIAGMGVTMPVAEAKTVSNAVLEDNSVLTVDKLSSTGEKPNKIRKAYLHFEGGEYENTQKATLNIDVCSANGQTVYVYGIINATYPASLTYETAPGSNADESMNTDYIYSGEPLATLELKSEGIYNVDVTDFVKDTAPDEYVFAIASEDVGGCEYLNLDFEAIPLTNGIDYIAESDITITGGAAVVSSNKIKLLNIFSNDGDNVKAGEKYKISVDITAAADGVYGIALDSATSEIPAGEAAVAQISAGETKNVEFEYTASETDEANNINSVSVYIDSGDASGFTIDNIKVSSETAVEISKSAELMIETAKEVEESADLVDITIVAVGGDSITVNGSDVGATATKSVAVGSVLALDASGAGEFMYWIDTANNSIVSYDKAFEFAVGSKRNIAAVFADEGEVYITFTSMKNKVVQHGISGSVTVPENPYVYGYEFAGWYNEGKKEALEAGGSVTADANTEYKAGYVKNSESYTVTVNSVALEKTYAYNEKVTVTADAEKDGKAFSYWALGENPVCYSTEYSFYVNGNTELTIVYDGEKDGNVLVMSAPVITDTNKLAFFAERDIPDELSVIESGILIGNSEKLSLESYKYKAVASSNSNKGQFTVRKKGVSSGETWYGVAYVIYRDSSGTVCTIYSNEVSYTI